MPCCVFATSTQNQRMKLSRPGLFNPAKEKAQLVSVKEKTTRFIKVGRRKSVTQENPQQQKQKETADMRMTRKQLEDRLSELEEYNDVLEDENEALNEKLDSIANLAAPEEDEDGDDDSDDDDDAG